MSLSTTDEKIYQGKKLICLGTEYGGVVVEFHNPKLKNALDLEMAGEAQELHKVLSEREPRVIIFKGHGDIFSAGGDLNMLEDLTTKSVEENKKTMMHIYSSFINLATLPCTTIAYVNGHAVGAGFCFALACDLRYVYRGAKLGLNFVKLGLAPGMGAEYWLHALPPALAREIIVTGNIYEAKDLKKFRLFNKLGSPNDIEEKVEKVARQVAANSRRAIAHSLQSLRNPQLSLQQVLENEAASQADCYANGQMVDAIAAVKTKQNFTFSD